MFKIHNPAYLDLILVHHDDSKEPRRIWAGSIKELQRLSEEEWETLKKKALRQAEGRHP